MCKVILHSNAEKTRDNGAPESVFTIKHNATRHIPDAAVNQVVDSKASKACA